MHQPKCIYFDEKNWNRNIKKRKESFPFFYDKLLFTINPSSLTNDYELQTPDYELSTMNYELFYPFLPFSIGTKLKFSNTSSL